MENKRGRKGASAGAWRVRKCCSRRGFLCVFNVLVNEGHSVMFLLVLRCLQG